MKNQGTQLADAIKHGLVKSKKSQNGSIPAAIDIAKNCFSHLASEFDDINGGFGSAPKFPKPGE